MFCSFSILLLSLISSKFIFSIFSSNSNILSFISLFILIPHFSKIFLFFISSSVIILLLLFFSTITYKFFIFKNSSSFSLISLFLFQIFLILNKPFNINSLLNFFKSSHLIPFSFNNLTIFHCSSLFK